MLDKLNHYSLTNPGTIYDEEALTALELAGRTAAKVNEAVTAFNTLEKETNDHLSEQDKEIDQRMEAQDNAIDKMVNETMPARVTDEMQQRIDSGEFAAEINAYAGDLEGRVDNLLGSVTHGSTTMDAEIIDGRTDMHGTAHPNIGAAVRAQTTELSEQIKNGDGFNRVNLIKGYVLDKYINGNGSIGEQSGLAYTEPIYLAAGSRVYAKHFPAYGSNHNCFLWDAAFKTLAPFSPVEYGDNYSLYDITTSGYYSFNSLVGVGCVCFNSEGLNYPAIGVYMPKDLIPGSIPWHEIDHFDRPNLVKNVKGGYINEGRVIPWDGLMYCYSQPIYLKAGERVYTPYTNLYGANTHLWMVSADGTPVYNKAEKVNADTEHNEYLIEYEGYYAVNGTNGYACCVKNLADLNAPMGCFLPGDLLDYNSPLKGKIITFNGDSICEGSGFKGGYGKIIAENHAMQYENIAVGGGTITAEQYRSDSGAARHWVSRTIANMRADADFAIVEGGVNDAALGVPLGAITPDYSSNLDDTTFYGAAESMCKQLSERFAGKKIGYIFVHKMLSGFSSDYPDNYYQAMKKCLEKWGVPYLDLNVKCPPLNYIESLKAAYTISADGWHPNEAGYRAYYVPKIVSWLESL